ncbi:transcription factor aceii [Colletotrichum incanum]|uniref:Transcription factor aceii n=1 Tax=Colletotrichum incanum TaxID=1573173 RepID=A0A162N794_COLIC|nr:transcription factor aceii [Colletotrichum incanum]
MPLPNEPLDWGNLSFDHFMGSSDMQNDGAIPTDEATQANIPVKPRVQCFEALSTLAATLERAMSAFPPVAKYRVPGSKFMEHCIEISKQYSLKDSLELLLSQTQNLFDIYPETVRLALEQLPIYDCSVADCIHT